jgi:pseudaminic acid cytidylyltransferase
MSKTIAIIPARGGSKRIPRKNIRHFMDKPIIAYSIEAALKSGLFDEVIVSTDDDEIAEVAGKYGASVPFIRSPETADDFASTADVLLEVLDEYKRKKIMFDYGCCIYPTAPFITAEKLKAAFELMLKYKYSSVFPVVRFSYPIQRALRMQNGKASMFHLENLNKRSQDLEPFFHDAGQFYWFNIIDFISEKKLFTDNSGAIIIDETEAQDIDHETDWLLAELKYQMIQNK